MEIPDAEVYKTLQKVAQHETIVERVAKFIDNGEMDKRIAVAVKHGVEGCPFYTEGKARKKINTAFKWIITLCVPILMTVLTLFATGVFIK